MRCSICGKPITKDTGFKCERCRLTLCKDELDYDEDNYDVCVLCNDEDRE